MAVAILGASASAAAETSLHEHAPGVGKRPTTQLYEASCDLDVQLRGAAATIEVRQRIVNPGPDSMAASYEFDLPPGATVTGLSLKGRAGTAHALPVRGELETVDVARRQMIGVDPALLEALPEGSTSQYVIRLQPIAPEHEVVLTTRFAVLATIRAGALRLVLPGRTGGGKLTACRGTIRAVAGPGASVTRLLVDRAASGARGTAAFVLDTKDVMLDAELAFTRKEPVVWTQTEPLPGGWSATLVTVAAPSVRSETLGHRRALFVIDISRSMELVGRPHVTKVMRTVASALPAGTEVDAIVYDRTASRVLGAWQPATPASLAALEHAVAARGAVNGSDLPGALRLAHTAIAESRTPTLVIVISDGVLGEVSGSELTRALDGKTSTLDVLAVVLDPARTTSPGAEALRAPVNLYGGAYVEVNVDELDTALTAVDEWLRPSWLELSLAGLADIPASVHSGSGFTRTLLHRGLASKLVLTGHGERPIRIAPRVAPAAPVAALVLAGSAGDPELHRDDGVRARAETLHPYARDGLAFAVLSTSGSVARNRLAVVKGGGPYERIVELPDPTTDPIGQVGPQPVVASAIARITLERLFRDQLQPKAYACYQRALGQAPKLTGTVHFTFHLGRGEITQVSLAGLEHAGLDACLLDAAYQLHVPLPDFTINADDQTIARYPLTFNIAEDRPRIVLGDADSSSPLDIDAIEGGVPARKTPMKVDATTPLGGMRP